MIDQRTDAPDESRTDDRYLGGECCGDCPPPKMGLFVARRAEGTFNQATNDLVIVSDAGRSWAIAVPTGLAEIGAQKKAARKHPNGLKV